MRRIFVLASALLLPACVAQVPMATPSADIEGKTFSPAPPGHGALYVYRSSLFAPAVATVISVDERPLGALAPHTWYRVDLYPGDHIVRCSGGENSDLRKVRLPADETRFVEVHMRMGFAAPRCSVSEVAADDGRPAILEGRRAYMPDEPPAAATPDSLVSIVYRDEAGTEANLKGVVRYGGVLGRDKVVSFTIKNKNGEPACDGILTNQDAGSGTFSMSCFNNRFRSSGTYERKTGDPIDHFVARGATTSGSPINISAAPARAYGGE